MSSAANALVLEAIEAIEKSGSSDEVLNELMTYLEQFGIENTIAAFHCDTDGQRCAARTAGCSSDHAATSANGEDQLIAFTAAIARRFCHGCLETQRVWIALFAATKTSASCATPAMTTPNDKSVP